MKISLTFDEKIWGFGHAKSWIFINFTGELQCRRGFRLFRKSYEKSWKMYAKMAPKMIQNRARRRLGARFLRFWEVSGGCWFLMSFGMCKKSTKNDKSSTLGRPKAIRVHILVRPGGMSGAAGGSIRGVEILVKLVKFGIGQKVLGIWNWTVWQELQDVFSTHCSPARAGGGGFKARARIPPGLFLGLSLCG